MFRRQLTAILLFCAVGCSQPPADKAAAVTGESDNGSIADVAPVETSNPADVAVVDAAKVETANAACPGSAGCACLKADDCDNALCIEDPSVDGGLACATKCVTDCASGYACAPVTAAGGDITTICVPKFVRLCDPCAVSKDCEALGLKDSACVDQGALGRFCGTSCGDAGDCPKDFGCQEVATAEGGKLKQCVRLPDDGGKSAFGTCACSAKAVAKKLATACYVEAKDADGKVVGKCAGTRACESKGLSGCSAPPAVAEICDGLDNDCNGQTDEAGCDDKNACTTDVCDGKGGCQHKLLDGQSCDADGSVCTEGDSCQIGVCVAGAKKDCDDKNACTADSCDLAKGCTHADDDGKPCDADGTACTAGDVCQGAKCIKGQAITCDDGNPCTIDKCDSKTGQCGATSEDDGIPCDDGTKCTNKDACSSGVCKGKAVACDDDNPCTDDVCDKTLGCKPTALTGAPCSDDNPCTIGDACDSGSCKPGAAKVCVVPSNCVLATCDVTASGKCVFKNAKNGSACDDGSACTDKDACLDGGCDGAVKNCDDGNPCTDDGCDSKGGCSSSPNTSPCSDGNACTQLDKCAGGKCVGQAVDLKVDCDDGNGCTSDACEPKIGCTHAANQLPCDDGNPCTAGDQCGDTTCKPGASTCGCQSDGDCAKQDDADLCNGVLFCDKSVLGQFACKTKLGSVVVCDAGLNTACSQQICEPVSGKCGGKAVVDGKVCDADGSVCTDGDSCAIGVCAAGGKIDCDDKNVCTTDSCDAKLGCAHNANNAACDADGNACTLNDVCKDKVCLPGGKKLCDDGEFCTADSCDKISGNCVFDGAGQAGQGCDADGSVCTVGDSCGGGKCLAGKIKACDDGNPCTDDSCDGKTGCVYSPNQSPCDDGNACTKNDLCAASQCAGKSLNPPVDCDDGQVCTSEGCDPKLGCTHAANQQACDDGNPCTQGDLCANKACQSGGNICACQKDADCAAQEDGDLCNGTLFCDTAKVPYGCKVKAVTVIVCDLSKDTVCASNQCAPVTGKCGMVSAADGKFCDADGSVCTSGDECEGGVCKAGAKIVCDDKNVCTNDSCDAVKGCVSVANSVPCDDGNACTGADVCGGGKCAGGPVVCDDKDPCTVDSCDAVKGCVAVTVADKTDCSVDGKNWCLVGKCGAKQVCGNGAVEGSEECDDGNKWDGDGCSSSCKCGLDGAVRCKGGTCTDTGCGFNPPNQMITAPVSADFAGKPGAAIEVIVRQDFTSQYGKIVNTSDVGINYGGDVGYGGNKGKWVGCWAGVCIWALKPAQLGSWQHLAMTFDQGTVRFFVNGVLQGQAKGNSLSVPAVAQNVINFGGTAVQCGDGNCNQQFNGAFRAIRISKVTRYTADFAPSAVLGADADTLQLYGLDELAGITAADSVAPNLVSSLKNGAAWESAGAAGTCIAFLAKASCKAWLLSNGALPDGVYPIDPDGAGPIAAANLFCDMKNGGWTIVGNFYDSAGDDMPNDTSYVVSGWQQTGSGKWDAKASTVDRAWGGGTGSAAVSLAFIEALGKTAGQKNLKMCFVHKDGYDTTCRTSFDGSMTLVSYPGGNPKLAAYASDKLTYTFGRLAGLAGTTDGYVYAQYTGPSSGSGLVGGACIPRALGVQNEFGDQSTPGMCQNNSNSIVAAEGVWTGWGYGMSYRPTHAADDELGSFDGANPSVNTYGFRLYIGP